jgi:hypothetical protein
MKNFETISRIISIIFMLTIGALLIVETRNTIEVSNLLTITTLVIGVAFMYVGIYGAIDEIKSRQN